MFKPWNSWGLWGFFLCFNQYNSPGISAIWDEHDFLPWGLYTSLLHCSCRTLYTVYAYQKYFQGCISCWIILNRYWFTWLYCNEICKMLVWISRQIRNKAILHRTCELVTQRNHHRYHLRPPRWAVAMPRVAWRPSRCVQFSLSCCSSCHL